MGVIINLVFTFVFMLSIMAMISEDMYNSTVKGMHSIMEKAIPNATILGKIFLLAILAFLLVFRGFFFLIWKLKIALEKPLSVLNKVVVRTFFVLFIKKKTA